MVVRNSSAGFEWLAASAIAAAIVGTIIVAFLNRGLG
jgi:hypothetical protein